MQATKFLYFFWGGWTNPLTTHSRDHLTLQPLRGSDFHASPNPTKTHIIISSSHPLPTDPKKTATKHQEIWRNVNTRFFCRLPNFLNFAPNNDRLENKNTQHDPSLLGRIWLHPPISFVCFLGALTTWGNGQQPCRRGKPFYFVVPHGQKPTTGHQGRVITFVPRWRVSGFWKSSRVTWAMKKTLVGWVLYGIILPSYIGIIMNDYKDPY